MKDKFKKLSKKRSKGGSVFSVISLILLALSLVVLIVASFVVGYIRSAKPDIDTEWNPFTQPITDEITNPDTEPGQTLPKTEETTPPETSEAPGTVPSTPNVTAPDTIPSGKPPVVTGPVERKEDFYNILVVGRDVEASNTDTIMVVSYNVKDGEVNVLQIPRDSYVLWNNTPMKINCIYATAYYAAAEEDPYQDLVKAGLKQLEQTVERTFGIAIDNYVYLNLDAFKNIVRVLGGVTVYVPEDMYRTQSGKLYLKKGYNRLGVEEAEYFVRYRKGYVQADIGRIDAQKIFLTGLLNEILSTDNITKIPQLISTMYKYVTTNMDLSACTYFGKNIIGLDFKKVRFYTANGEPFVTKNGKDYYTLYAKENLEIINKAFNCFNKDITADIVTLREMSRVPGAGIINTTGYTADNISDNGIDIPRK